MSWRSGSDDGLSNRRMWVRVYVIASFFFFNVFSFFLILLLLQSDFNIDLYPIQFLLLFLPHMMPGYQRLQRFDINLARKHNESFKRIIEFIPF